MFNNNYDTTYKKRVVLKNHLFSYVMCFMLSIVAIVGALNISDTFCYDYVEYDNCTILYTDVFSNSYNGLTPFSYSISSPLVDLSECSVYLYDFELKKIAVDTELAVTINAYNSQVFTLSANNFVYIRIMDDGPKYPFTGSINEVVGFVAYSESDTYYFVPRYIDILNRGYRDGYNTGLTNSSDYDAGYSVGYSDGEKVVKYNPGDYGLYTETDYVNYGNEKYDEGCLDGETEGYSHGYEDGSEWGLSEGYEDGYYAGQSDLYDNISEDPTNYGFVTEDYCEQHSETKYTEGFNNGYVTAESDYLNGDSAFHNLLFSIIDAPFNVLSNAFDFEIFGINMSSFLIAIVSLLLVFFVIRSLM